MASPCEVRVETQDPDLIQRVGAVVEAEALRIEKKYSRYRDDNIIARINQATNEPIKVDDETSDLLNYAQQCFELSNGQFDITSGILRRVWRFDGSNKIPSKKEVEQILPLIGWDKLTWSAPYLTLRPGMEVDLGGVGKEYAVDRALMAMQRLTDQPALVNFGGDLRATGSRSDGSAWKIGLLSVDIKNKNEAMLALHNGALATSGDAERYLLKDGIRYSHILDPRTGWPVKNPPRSVTVSAPTCMEAGVLSTMAMLQGERAERFLKKEHLRAWCIR
ncbi:MAG: thiamine biosynthesis protein ApbE [Robiginitomaculum sp.]|nr:MAG: thiamine biosynthesis protein ApbE [Robiginitomaculum sp.]